MPEKRSRTLVHIVTVPISLRFFEGQIAYFKKQGFDVHVISSPGKILDQFGADEGVSVYGIEMARKITPLRDLLAVWRLWRTLSQIKPDIVHAHTPKGGLLGMISAWLARVHVRIYHARGLPFEVATGKKRQLLIWAERVSSLLSNRVFCNSRSNLDVMVANKICKESKITMLHNGSGNGVDATDLFTTEISGTERARIRANYNIPADSLVIGFVGRIVRDKGVEELIEAWHQVRDQHPNVRMLFVGPFESQNAISDTTKSTILHDNRIVHVDFVEDKCKMPQFYSAMDMLVLPSHREGFPNVLLEAAAMELPVISTLTSGCIDAVDNGETGILVPVESAQALLEAIQCYLDNPELRSHHGTQGRERVLRDFRPEDIWKAQVKEYEQLLGRCE